MYIVIHYYISYIVMFHYIIIIEAKEKLENDKQLLNY